MFEKIEDEKLSENEKCTAIEELMKDDPEELLRLTLGCTHLHYAVENNLLEVAKLLLKLGISVNVVGETMQTPLMIAAEKGYAEMLLLLGFQEECNFNIVDSSKQSALHKAVMNNHPLCVQYLVQLGQSKIDKDLRDINNNSAADYIRKIKNLRLQKILGKAYVYTDLFERTLLQEAVIDNSVELVKLYLELGAPLNQQDNDGRTALHLAALGGYSQILLMLCHYDKIEMNVADKYGNTALHYGAERGDKDCLQILVTRKKAVDKTIINNAGFTAEQLIKGTDKEEVNFLKNILLSSQVKQHEDEIFYFRQNDFSSYKFKEFLNHQFITLEFSLKGQSESRSRRMSDGSSSKLLKSTKSSLKRVTSFFQDDTNSNEGDHILERTFLKNDPNQAAMVIAKALKMDAKHAASLMKILDNLIQKHRNDTMREFLLMVIRNLQQIDLNQFNEQLKTIQSPLRNKLLADGLKILYKPQEMNQLEDIHYLSITDHPELLAKLRKITEICSGELSENEFLINREVFLYKSLGMIDFIEPSLFISYLRKLHPHFSKPQRLNSHVLAFSLLNFYDLYCFDPKEKQAFINEVELYFKECSTPEISADVAECIKLYASSKKNPLSTVIAHIKSSLPQLVQKESINDLINEYVHYKAEQNVIAITRAFNLINAKFYQDCLLKEFRLECWKEDLLTGVVEHSKLCDKMVEFICNKICSFSTPQKQAAAISLFILVAREALHYQYGADLSLVMVIITALSSEQIVNLKDVRQNLDKKILDIETDLTKLFSPRSNFKYYHELMEINEDALPAIAILFKDKTASYENGPLMALEGLGRMYKSLILLKKNLEPLILEPQSDLLELLYLAQDMTKIEEASGTLVRTNSNNTENVLPIIEYSHRYLSSKKDILPRIISRKESKTSSGEKESPRSPHSQSPNSPPSRMHHSPLYSSDSSDTEVSPRKSSSERSLSRKSSTEQSSPRTLSPEKISSRKPSPSEKSTSRRHTVGRSPQRKISAEKEQEIELSPNKVAVEKKDNRPSLMSSSSPEMKEKEPNLKFFAGIEPSPSLLTEEKKEKSSTEKKNKPSLLSSSSPEHTEGEEEKVHEGMNFGAS